MIEGLDTGELHIAVRAAAPPQPLQLVWTGRSSDRHPGKTLDPYLSVALSTAAARGTSVELHFEALEHFNSSTVTCVIKLIQDARENGVPLVLVYDGKRKWQQLSFEALRIFVLQDQLLELRPA